jgi:hypothetical protein
VHALHEAGVPAHLALIRSQGALVKAVPSLDQFAHMVVFVPDASKPRVLQKRMTDSGQKLLLTSAEMKNLDDVSKPLQLSLVDTASSSFRRSGAGLVGQPPAVWEHEYLSFEKVADRRTPFELDIPMHIESTVRLQAPSTMKLETPVELAQHGETPYGKWQVMGQRTGELLELKLVADVPAGTYGPGDYDGFQRTLDDASEALRPTLTLGRQPVAAAP